MKSAAKRFWRGCGRLMSCFLSAAIAGPCLCQFPLTVAAEGTPDASQEMHISVLGWPASLGNSTTSWMGKCSAGEQALTRQALAEEIQRLYVQEGYRAGPMEGVAVVDTWAPTWTPAGIIINLDAPDSDNIGKIHGEQWGFAPIGTILSSPYAGMAFSQIRYMSQDYVAQGWPALLSNTFLHNGRYYSVTWDKVKSYDSQIPEERGRVLTAEQLTYVDQYPGKGLPDDGNHTFRYAFARYNQAHKAESRVVGIPVSDAAMVGDIAYQVYDGPSGRAYIAGTADAIQAADATPEKPEGAYVIAGELARAFETLGETDAERFSAAGAPLGEAYEARGLLCQDFQQFTLAVDPDTEEVVQTSNDTGLHDFAIEGGRMLDDVGEGINILVPAGTDLTAITPSFTIHPRSTITPSAGALDFSQPVRYTVTSELGVSKTYVVTIIEDGPGNPEDAKAAEAAARTIDELPAEITRTDAAQVREAKERYDMLSPRQRYLVHNTDKLYAALDMLEALDAEKIKVACIGDSITEGALGDGGVVAATGYPAQLQEMLGERYEVRNFGKCGYCATRNSNAPYWNLPEFQASQEYQPDIVIIMLGTNDAWSGNWNVVQNDFERDYTELVNTYKSLDSRPILYLTKVCEDYGTDRGAVPEINAIIEQIAQATSSRLADMYTWTSSFSAGDRAKYFPDNLHPTARGYTLMAEQFKQQIFDALSEEDENRILDGRLLKKAASLAQKAIDGLMVSNETTADQILRLADQAVDNDRSAVSWNTPFAIQKATAETEGRVTGAIELLYSGQSLVLTVDKVIEHLTASDEEMVDEAKASAEEALASFRATNQTAAGDILAAVKAAVDNPDVTVAWKDAFTLLIPATEEEAGSVTGVLIFTAGEASATVTVELTIPVLQEQAVPGDLDKDSEVTIADVMEACKVMARESAGTDPTDDEIARGDLDGDGEITIADVMEICKILARGA